MGKEHYSFIIIFLRQYYAYIENNQASLTNSHHKVNLASKLKEYLDSLIDEKKQVWLICCGHLKIIPSQNDPSQQHGSPFLVTMFFFHGSFKFLFSKPNPPGTLVLSSTGVPTFRDKLVDNIHTWSKWTNSTQFGPFPAYDFSNFADFLIFYSSIIPQYRPFFNF